MKKRLFINLLLVFFVIGCSRSESPTKQDEQPSENIPPVTIDYSEYFMPNESTAYFEGVGIEYASYSVYTKWINDHYVATITDNGGATVQRIYRLTDEEVDIVSEEVIDTLAENTTFPEVSKLDTLQAKDVYFKQPLKTGETFGKWNVVATNEELETPFDTFQNVIVLEEKDKQWVNRHYFVKGYGMVKEEAIMQQTDDSEQPFSVTSTLKSIQLH